MKKQFRKMRRKPFYLPLALPIAAGLVLLVFAFWWYGQWQSTTVIIVRHAEKAVAADDPALASAGITRAARLAQLLSPLADTERPRAVYATDYRRTRQTAQTVAAAWQVDVTLYEPGKASTTARKVRKAHPGGVVLLVGHSNTVGDLVAAFGGPAGVEIDEDEYDNLFVLTVPPWGRSTALRLSYGAASP